MEAQYERHSSQEISVILLQEDCKFYLLQSVFVHTSMLIVKRANGFTSLAFKAS